MLGWMLKGVDLQSKDVWAEQELILVCAAEGVGLADGVIKLEASFLVEALTGYTGATGSGQALHDAAALVEAEV